MKNPRFKSQVLIQILSNSAQINSKIFGTFFLKLLIYIKFGSIIHYKKSLIFFYHNIADYKTKFIHRKKFKLLKKLIIKP